MSTREERRRARNARKRTAAPTSTAIPREEPPHPKRRRQLDRDLYQLDTQESEPSQQPIEQGPEPLQEPTAHPSSPQVVEPTEPPASIATPTPAPAASASDSQRATQNSQDYEQETEDSQQNAAPIFDQPSSPVFPTLGPDLDDNQMRSEPEDSTQELVQSDVDEEMDDEEEMPNFNIAPRPRQARQNVPHAQGPRREVLPMRLVPDSSLHQGDGQTGWPQDLAPGLFPDETPPVPVFTLPSTSTADTTSTLGKRTRTPLVESSSSEEEEELEYEESDEEELPSFDVTPRQRERLQGRHARGDEDLSGSSGGEGDRPIVSRVPGSSIQMTAVAEGKLRDDYSALVKELDKLVPTLVNEMREVSLFIDYLPLNARMQTHVQNFVPGIRRLALMAQSMDSAGNQLQKESKFIVLINAIKGRVENRYYEFGFNEVERKLKSLLSFAWTNKATDLIHHRMKTMGYWSYCRNLVNSLTAHARRSADYDSYKRTLERFDRGLKRALEQYVPRNVMAGKIPLNYRDLYHAEERALIDMNTISTLYVELQERWLKHWPDFRFAEMIHKYVLPTGNLRQGDEYSLEVKGWYSRGETTVDLNARVSIVVDMGNADFYSDIVRVSYPRSKLLIETLDKMKQLIDAKETAFEYMVASGARNVFYDPADYDTVNLLPDTAYDFDPENFDARPLSVTEILEYINNWRPVSSDHDVVYPTEDNWARLELLPNSRIVQHFTSTVSSLVNQEVPFPSYKLGMFLRPSTSAEEVAEASKLHYVKDYGKRLVPGEAGTHASRYVLEIDMQKAHKSALISLIKDNADKIAHTQERQWFITINSNMTVGRLAEEASTSESGFKSLCEGYIGTFIPGFISNTGTYTMANLLGWEIQHIEVEIGPQTGKVHCHLLLKVTMVVLLDEELDEMPGLLLDYANIRGMFLQKFPSCYVNCELVNTPLTPGDDDWEQRISAYIYKGRNKTVTHERGTAYVGVMNPGGRSVTRNRARRRRN